LQRENALAESISGEDYWSSHQSRFSELLYSIFSRKIRGCTLCTSA